MSEELHDCVPCQVVAYACTGGTHKYIHEVPAEPSQRKYLSRIRIYFWVLPPQLWKRKAAKSTKPLALRQISEEKGGTPGQQLIAMRRHGKRHLQTQRSVKEQILNTAQRERTNPNTKIGQILARQGLSTINTPLPPPRRRKEDHPWRLKRTIA